MSFDLTNYPVAFIDFMNRVFWPYLDKFVVAFIDNILIYSKDRDKHITHLRMMLRILGEHQLHSKYKKHDLWLEEVAFRDMWF